MSPRDPRLDRAKLIQLMAYADGELDADDLAALEDELTQNPAAVEVVDSIRGLGDRVRRDMFTAPDLTDAIMAHVSAASSNRPTSVAAVEGAKVLDLAAMRARRFKIATAVGSLVAVAAAVMLWIGGRPAGELPISSELATSAMGVEVQQVDSRENVTVFSIPALHSNASSVVVWLGDDHQDEAAEPAEQVVDASSPKP